MTKTQSLFTVSDLRPISQNVFLISLNAPEIASAAKPGQFVHIKCGHSRPLRRPFGICDVNGDTLTIVFEVRGEGTKWLAGRGVGRRVDIFGPLGNGFSQTRGKTLLVGGGLGVTPLLFAAKSHGGLSTAVLGFRNRAGILLADDFEALCAGVLISTDDGSYGLRGTVARPVEELLRTENFERVLACGPRPMLKAVAELAEHYGVLCEVSLEERMGCGVGACLVCACATKDSGGDIHMSRVCRDGPVFNASEVVW